MTDALAEITRRLASGESLEAIARSQRPPHWAPALRVCAVARTFDATLYEAVLGPTAAEHGDGDAPGLVELLHERAIQPAGGLHRTYTLSEQDRTSYFLDWIGTGTGTQAAPAALLSLERRIADQRLAEGDHAEAVRHLLLPSAEDALALFHDQFTAADRRRDFAACQDLVDALGDPDRLPYLPPDISELALDRAGYVRARDHWAADFARSAQFLKPTELLLDAEQLLAGEQQVWQLYAPGGAGKTMQLRWLVSRYCVPAPRDVPCARIDFDVVNPNAVGRHPWLLLLEMADQFGRRLSGRPFESLTAGYGVHRVLLDRMPSNPSSEAAATIDSLDTYAIEAELVAGFANRLNLAVAGRPAVLVIDTLEELLLHGQAEAERLLRMFSALLDLCPGLRLILAGRYNLRTRLPKGLRSLRKHQVKHMKVRPFTMSQARTYLTDVRGIRNPQLVRTAVRKARGLPFALALLADLVEHDPYITAAELEACDEPLVRYLIDRVVRRIDDPAVRWLLRYGVIPRRLRKEDVFTVMRPWLARGITDTSEADDPRKDNHHLRGSEDVFPFAAAEPTDDDLERSWQRLLDYAGSSSWVSRQPGDDSTVVFHANVLAPMRLLISGHQVYGELHHAFVAHFEGLAEARPEQWVVCTKEATYHRFQAGDPAAEEVWSEALLKAGTTEPPDKARELAEEVLGEEYLERGRPRIRADGEPLIKLTAVMGAHLAVAGTVAHRYLNSPVVNPSDPALNEVERRLALVDQLQQGSTSPRHRETALHLRAIALFGRGRLDEAAELVQSALETELTDWTREKLQIILSRVQDQLSDPDAESTYRSAMETARTRGDEQNEALISLELAQSLEDRGRVDEAINLRTQVPQTASRHSGTQAPSVYNRALLSLAGAHLLAFDVTKSLDALRKLDRKGPETASAPERIEARQREAQAYAMLGRSRLALAALDQADRIAQSDIHDSTRYRYLADIAMRRGLLSGEVLSVDSAERSFARATALWSDLGYQDGHPECLLLYARFLTYHLGDLRRAAQALQHLQEVDTAGEHTVAAALLWHDLAFRTFDVPDPSLLSIPLRSRKDLLDGGVAAVLAAPGRASALAEALADVQPPEARLAALDGLSRCGAPEGDPLPELELLRPLFSPLADAGPATVDRYVRLTRLAEFERVSGRHTEATRLMTQAHGGLCEAAEGSEPMAKWRWAQAQIRFNGVPERRLSRSLCTVAASESPLMRATALWLLALTEKGTEQKRALLHDASEQLGLVQQPSLWNQFVLRSIAMANDDEATLQIATRMSATLGYRQEGERPSVPSSFGDTASEHEDVYRVDTSFRVTSAPLPTAYALSANWRDLTSANSGSLRRQRRGIPPLQAMRLQVDDILAHAFPWELAFIEHRLPPYRTLPEAAETADVRAVQAALNAQTKTKLVIDGRWGHLTHAALTGFVVGVIAALPAAVLSAGAVPAAATELVRRSRERARARSRPQALVLACDPTYDNQSYAASVSAPTSRAVLGAYHAHGFATHEARSLRVLPKLQDPPAVIHISAPLRLAGGINPCFDLSAAELSHSERLNRTATGGDLEPEQLVAWLKQFEPGTQPLVVLDPPRPGSPADIPLQLVLRNLFAANLFSSGHAPSVLGIGLLRGTRKPQTDLLARALRADIPLLRLLADLRGHTDPAVLTANWGEDNLERLCVSLFASPATLRVSEAEATHP
ncbi:hypothetical protein [Streptomyces panaciradicis]|uniref:hypothetical protein n=1 Tax=Streptomyces panaciradicis TaxID=1470261 RepID=UPI00201D14E5|nr:hypothetical protein [Streptomyces panaciradicis]MCL6671611.1 hypothetical protein [Streptomyces panaciradicis]